MNSDDRIERLGLLLQGKEPPATPLELAFLTAYSGCLGSTKEVINVSESMGLDNYLDTEIGMVAMGAMMACLKREANKITQDLLMMDDSDDDGERH